MNDEVKDTMIFNIFFLCQVLNEFNLKRLQRNNGIQRVHKNKLFPRIIGITILFQVRMVEFLKEDLRYREVELGAVGSM